MATQRMQKTGRKHIMKQEKRESVKRPFPISITRDARPNGSTSHIKDLTR